MPMVEAGHGDCVAFAGTKDKVNGRDAIARLFVRKCTVAIDKEKLLLKFALLLEAS
jgi:hypothetical protein